VWQAYETSKKRALYCASHAEEVRQWCVPLQASEMPGEGALYIHSMMKKRGRGTSDGKQMTCPKR